jgi:hypothetical protein
MACLCIQMYNHPSGTIPSAEMCHVNEKEHLCNE